MELIDGKQNREIRKGFPDYPKSLRISEHKIFIAWQTARSLVSVCGCQRPVQE